MVRLESSTEERVCDCQHGTSRSAFAVETKGVDCCGVSSDSPTLSIEGSSSVNLK